MSAKLKDLVNPEFINSLNKLRYHPDLKAALAFKILPISKKIQNELKNYETLRLEACKKYCKKGDDGEPTMLPIDGGVTRFVFDPEVQTSFEDELKSLQEVDVEIPKPVVKVSEIKDITLAIADLEILVGTVLVGE